MDKRERERERATDIEIERESDKKRQKIYHSVVLRSNERVAETSTERGTFNSQSQKRSRCSCSCLTEETARGRSSGQLLLPPTAVAAAYRAEGWFNSNPTFRARPLSSCVINIYYCHLFIF